MSVISIASNGNKAKGVAATPKPLPKTLKPVLIAPGATLFFSIPSALDLLALIVDGAATAVDLQQVHLQRR